MRGIRGADIAMVFQEPMTALNPLRRSASRSPRACGCTRAAPGRRARARDRAAAAHRDSRAGAAHRQLPAPAVGRPAATRDDRDGAGVPTAPAARGRADHRARRDGAPADRRSADRAAGAGGRCARDGRAADHARPEPRAALRAARGRDGEGRTGGEQHDGRPVRGAAASDTRRLLDSAPQRAVEPVAAGAQTILDVQHLAVDYRIAAKGWRSVLGKTTFRAVHDVQLSLKRGETLGIVGESGRGNRRSRRPCSGCSGRRRAGSRSTGCRWRRCARRRAGARCTGACRWCSRIRSARCRRA